MVGRVKIDPVVVRDSTGYVAVLDAKMNICIGDIDSVGRGRVYLHPIEHIWGPLSSSTGPIVQRRLRGKISITIDGDVRVSVLGVFGRQVGLGGDAPQSVIVHREEV